MLENELYEPMRNWLEQYLKDKYKGYDITVLDTSQERLDRALSRYDIVCEAANGVDIQIDVLGIARKNRIAKLFFIEAKKTRLTIRDLGQLWAYCKLIDPEEAFLLSSHSLGSLNKFFISSQNHRICMQKTDVTRMKMDPDWQLKLLQRSF